MNRIEGQRDWGLSSDCYSSSKKYSSYIPYSSPSMFPERDAVCFSVIIDHLGLCTTIHEPATIF